MCKAEKEFKCLTEASAFYLMSQWRYIQNDCGVATSRFNRRHLRYIAREWHISSKLKEPLQQSNCSLKRNENLSKQQLNHECLPRSENSSWRNSLPAWQHDSIKGTSSSLTCPAIAFLHRMKKAAACFQEYAYAMTATSVVGVEENNRMLLRKPKVKTLLVLWVPTVTQNTCGWGSLTEAAGCGRESLCSLIYRSHTLWKERGRRGMKAGCCKRHNTALVWFWSRPVGDGMSRMLVCGCKASPRVLGLGNSTDGCYQGCSLCCVSSREDREESSGVRGNLWSVCWCTSWGSATRCKLKLLFGRRCCCSPLPTFRVSTDDLPSFYRVKEWFVLEGVPVCGWGREL